MTKADELLVNGKVNDSHAMASVRIKEGFSDGTYENLGKSKRERLNYLKSVRGN